MGRQQGYYITRDMLSYGSSFFNEPEKQFRFCCLSSSSQNSLSISPCPCLFHHVKETSRILSVLLAFLALTKIVASSQRKSSRKILLCQDFIAELRRP